MRSLVIGDIHFKYKHEIEGNEFIEKVTKVAKKYSPDFIVLLGDILHTHETIKVQSHNIAELLITNLSKIAHTYVIMGNHDLIDHTQFLTSSHVFGPFKRWKNVTIVDKVVSVEMDDKTFFFVPYVPPGRFIEALNTSLPNDGNEMWEMADCIFAHQEFKGCFTGELKSTKSWKSMKGDEWGNDYPIVISGHIHNEQIVGGNIYYPGSSTQTSFSDSSKKKVWIIDWDGDKEMKDRITKIDLGLEKKRLLIHDVKDITSSFVNDLVNEIIPGNIKLKIEGSLNDIKAFKKSGLNLKLENAGVVLDYEGTHELQGVSTNVLSKGMSSNDTFKTLLHSLIATKGESMIKEYEDMFGKMDERSSSNERTCSRVKAVCEECGDCIEDCNC